MPGHPAAGVRTALNATRGRAGNAGWSPRLRRMGNAVPTAAARGGAGVIAARWQAPCFGSDAWAGPAGSGLGGSRRGEAGVRAVAVGLLVEEQRGEVAASWKRSVERELGGDPALGFAVAPLLREMSIALRGNVPPTRAPVDGPPRSAVLVRSAASPARVAREFKLLHRALWETLRAGGHVVSGDERRAADEWLDEALAAALDRLDRVRMRIDLLERGPEVVPSARAPAPVTVAARPPPLPRDRPTLQRPPPLPGVLGPIGSLGIE